MSPLRHLTARKRKSIAIADAIGFARKDSGPNARVCREFDNLPFPDHYNGVVSGYFNSFNLKEVPHAYRDESTRPTVCFIGIQKPSHVDVITRNIPPEFGPQVMIGIPLEFIGSDDKPVHLRGNIKVAPRFRDIIRARSGDVKNIIYLSSRRKFGLNEVLRLVMDMAGEDNIDGIFLNVPWPSIRVLQDFREAHKNTLLFLKIGPEAYSMVNNNPSKLLNKLEGYEGLINRVVLNLCKYLEGGTFGPDVFWKLFGLLCEDNRFELDISGKIGPDNLKTYQGLINRYPGVGLLFHRSLMNEHGEFMIDRAVCLLTGHDCNVGTLYL